MANTDGAFGLRPLRREGGGPLVLEEMSIGSTLAENIFTGDVLIATGTGTNVSLAVGAVEEIVGVFAGCRYVDSSGNQVFSRYWPTGTTATDIVALVYRDPYIIYEAQCDTLAAADVNLLMDYDDGAGSATTGISGREVVASAGASTGQQLRCLRLSPTPGNAYGAYAKAEFMFAENAIKGVVSGVGGA